MAKTSGDLQAEIRKALEDSGWIVRKSIQFSTSGWTDLEAFKHPLRMFFCEVKSGKDTVSTLQKWRIAQLKYAGFPVYVVRDSDEIKRMIEKVNTDWSSEIYMELNSEEKAMVGLPEPAQPEGL